MKQYIVAIFLFVFIIYVTSCSAKQIQSEPSSQTKTEAYSQSKDYEKSEESSLSQVQSEASSHQEPAVSENYNKSEGNSFSSKNESDGLPAEEIHVFKQDGKYGLQKGDSTILLPAEYDNISNFSEERAVINQGDKFGIVDTAGRIIVPVIYDQIDKYVDGIARVYIYTNPSIHGSLKGLVDADGNYIMEPIYEYLSFPLEDGKGHVILKEKSGIFDSQGNIIIPFMYDNFIGLFRDGLLCAKLDGKFGFINENNDIVIPFKYDYAFPFNNGHAIVFPVNIEVWDEPFASLRPTFSIVQYAVIDTDGGILHRENTLLKCYEIHYQFKMDTETGSYPIFDLSNEPIKSININSLYWYDGNLVEFYKYENQPIYNVVELHDEIPYKLSE